jgi:hypothetical protein
VRKDGTEIHYGTRRQQGVSVYREQERGFSVRDRVQLTASVPDLKLANRELAPVKAIGQAGWLSLKLNSGRVVELDPQQHPHLDHGCVVTSHDSQGQTAGRGKDESHGSPPAQIRTSGTHIAYGSCQSLGVTIRIGMHCLRSTTMRAMLQ